MTKLTVKQKAFADEYIKNGGNATQAAIKAGYSKKTANRTGPENLSKPVIKRYIADRLAPIEKEREISADDALNKLIDIWEGKVVTSHSKHINKLNNNKVEKDMQYEFTPDLESKIKALDLYLKYKSMLSQVQLKKAETEIKLMQKKLEALENIGEQTTEDKLDELLSKIGGELSGAD